MLKSVRQSADRILGVALAFLMGIAVINVLWQVFTRFVLNDPSSYTEEAAKYLLVWISLLASGYAVGAKSHLAIDILPTRLTGRSHIALQCLINSCIFAFALIALVIGGWRLAHMTLAQGQTSPAFGIRLGFVYFGIPAAGLVLMFYTALNVFDDLVRASSALETSSTTDPDSADVPVKG